MALWIIHKSQVEQIFVTIIHQYIPTYQMEFYDYTRMVLWVTQIHLAEFAHVS